MKLCNRMLAMLLMLAMLTGMLPAQYAHAATFTAPVVQTTATTGTMMIELQDSYGDGWDGNKLQLYINDALSATYKVGEDKSKYTTTLSYDSSQYYAFKWVLGSYSEECSIKISLDGTTIFTADGTDCAAYTDGQVVFVYGTVPVIVGSGTCGDNVTWKLEDNGKLTIFGTGSMDDYCSVNKIYDTVVSIDYLTTPWDDKAIKTVVIEEGVTCIGAGTFYWADNLTDITLADSVKKIGDCAFETCGTLRSITIPESVTSIGDFAFSGCRGLTEVMIPASIIKIGESAFADASNLAEISFRGDAPTLGDDLFLNVTATAYYSIHNDTWTTSMRQNYGGTITWKAIDMVLASGNCGVSTYWSLTESGVLTISGTGETDYWSEDEEYPPWHDYKDSIVKAVVEEGVRYVGTGAFSGCKNLTSAFLPNGLIAISPYMFSNCTALSNVNIPSTVGTIYKAAFSGCSSLTSITLPDSLSVIWDAAFIYCGLTEIVIPDGVTKIWNDAFKYSDLETVVIGKGLRQFGELVFAYCEALKTVRFTGSAPGCGANNVFARSGNSVAYYPAGDSSWTESARNCISRDVTWISWCDHSWSLATCTAPKTCSVCGTTEGELGDHVRDSAHKCTVCGQIGGECGENVTWVLDENGVLTISGTGPMADYAEYGNNAPWRSAYTDMISKVIIEDGVTSIGSFSFWQCKSLTEISIPDSVQRMGDGVFYACESLQAVTIPYGVPALGSNLFYKCTALTSIVLPDSVTTIGVSAFLMSGVRYVVLPASVTKIDGDAFASSQLWHVLYTGTEAQRANIDQVINYETYLDSATWHYGATGNEILPVDKSDCTSRTLFECAICGAVCTEPIYGGRHTYDQEVATEKYLKSAATCTAAAVYYKSCTCGAKGSETFAYGEALGHDLIQHEAKAPTCTDIGWEAYETCSRCDYSTYAELPANGAHTWGDWVVEKAATCTENGSRTRSCVYCVASWTEIIRALGHNLTQHAAKTPTCTDIGWEAYETCSRCDYTTYKELPANGHAYTGVVTDPTCIDGGYTTYTCHCGDSYIADLVDAQGHDRDVYHKCSRCGQIGGECGENVTWELGENGVLTISGTGDMYDFEYGTRSPWADYRPEIISVVIGDGVTSIGSCAFDYCFKMTSVTIGNSITIIGDYAFSSCEALTSINIPSSVTIIGDRAFEFCNALTSVTIPEGVTSVGIRAFENCIKLTGVEIPDSVTSIGAYAFYMCTSLKQVTFGANSQLLTIGKEAFKFTNINSIIIPKRVTHIGNSAFHYSGLNSLTFEENSQLSYIGDHAFDSCGMTNARIPDRVTSIGAGAFENCTHLVSITMGSGVTSIGDEAFANCHKLWHVLFTGSENQWYGISIGTDNTCLTNAVRHYNCAGGEITDLENLVCAACVANGYVPSGICGDHLTWRLESNGVLTISGTGDMYDYAYAPWYPYTRIIRKVVIESGATSIGNCAFASCNNLSEVTIPDGVTRIGNSAFIGCSGLAEIVLPDSITVIGERAFMNCGRLSEIVIPEGVTSIEYATFYNCDGLTSITLSDNLTSIGILAFGSCDSFVSITIPDGVEIIGESAFNSCKNLVSITIPASVTTIGANNFMSSLWHVLYKGAEEQWGQIQNSDKWITSATVHYSCTGDEIVDFANRICTICCNHKWSDATCTDPQICSICGFAGSEALGHDLTQHAAKAPTCTDIGWEAYETCSRCDYTTYKELPANGHNYTAVVTEPTCTDGGYTTYTCHCGDSYVADLVDPLGHDLTQHTAKAPTCTDIGWEAYETCSRCDYSTYAELPATGAHTWGDWVVEKVATCTENGSRTRSCVYCVASWTEIIRALGHDLTQQVAKAPTCTDIGWEAYETCSRCDHTTYRELPANGHAYTAVVIDPTCTDGGYTTYTCHCGDSYVADLVDALGHDLTQHAAKAPTCTDIGWEAYETCSRCDHSTYRELPANGHAYTAVVTEPTCTEGGYTTYTCHCRDSYVADLVDALGHSEAVLDAVAPGCTTEGLTEGSYCMVCGEVLTVQNKVPATGHKDENRDFLCDVCGADLCTDHVEMLLPSVAATCEGTGLTEGKKCANCGEILVAQETIPALGHSYEGVVVEPTCTELGYTVYTCEVCGDSYVDDFVETLAHAYVAVATKPTCTEAGYTTYTCADCGDRFIGSYVSAKGHSYDEGVVTTEPTCVRDGLLTYTCTDCGSTKTETLEKTGVHSYSSIVVEPTCTQLGYTVYTCETCGDSYVDDFAEPIAHDYIAVVTEPTCTEAGYTTYTCADCGDSYEGDYVDASGHSFGQWVTDQAPTCTEAGIRHRSCSACGETEVERIAELPHVFEGGACINCGAPEVAPGDVNGDGMVDTTDAKLIMQYDLGLIGEDGINLAAMDVNGDGKVDTTDAKLIMQLDLGLITEFPKP